MNLNLLSFLFHPFQMNHEARIQQIPKAHIFLTYTKKACLTDQLLQFTFPTFNGDKNRKSESYLSTLQPYIFQIIINFSSLVQTCKEPSGKIKEAAAFRTRKRLKVSRRIVLQLPEFLASNLNISEKERTKQQFPETALTGQLAIIFQTKAPVAGFFK